MNSDLIIKNFLSSHEGSFNTGYIKSKRSRHSDCFVVYLLGRADYIFNDRTLKVSAGDAFFLAKGSVYDIDIKEKSKYICIDFEFFEAKEKDVGFLVKDIGVTTSALFSKVLHISSINNDINRTKILSLIYEIYFELLKRIHEKYTKHSGMDKICNFIHLSYSSPQLTLESIEKETGISTSKIRRIFKSELHTTPIKYITHFRLEKAKIMLSDSNLSITEIAFATGFEDPFYFSRAFKKYCGASPSYYREMTRSFEIV